MSEEPLPSWNEAAASGSVEELVAWAQRDHHVDLTDGELVLTLAANGITNAVWRNNSEIENIHAKHYKRPGMIKPRGLSDAEMMVGNIETSRLVRECLAASTEEWILDVEDALLDYDRPYAGTPLTEHVTKKILAENSKQVRQNLGRHLAVEELVGHERYLLGAALCGLAYAHYGTPMWDSTVDSWVERTTCPPGDDVVLAMRTDPTSLDLAVIESALSSGLWGAARGRARWHESRCGDRRHTPSPELLSLLGMGYGTVGVPWEWLRAAGARLTERRQPQS